MEYLTDYNRMEYETLKIIEETCMSAKGDACRFKITLTYPARG
jgi:hypothetical protein